MWYYSFYGFAISHSQLHKQEISKVKTRVLSCVEKTADCRESAALNYERKHFGDASKRGCGAILENAAMRYAIAT